MTTLPLLLPLAFAVPFAVAALAVAQDTQPADDWRTPLDEKIEQHRKSDFTLTITGTDGRPLVNTKVDVEQVGHRFLFGTAIGGDINGDDPATTKYRQHILDHFNALVCENSMKWYACEKQPDEWTFEQAEEHMKFAEEHGMTMRGHCLFWAKDKWVQDWIKELDDTQLRQAMEERQDKTVPRYAGRVMGWDVNNEMLDGHFFERRLGADIRPWMFTRARELDPKAMLFVNDYALIGNRGRTEALLEQIKTLRDGGADVGGIGIQEHGAQQFKPENGPAAITQTLDQLAAAGVPLHITEVSFNTLDDERQAEAMEVFLRTSFAHPKVDAFMLWGFWANRHWQGERSGLLRKDWSARPAWDVWNRLIQQEWTTRLPDAATDADGTFKFRGFHGDYRVTWTDEAGQEHESTVSLGPEETNVRVKLGAAAE